MTKSALKKLEKKQTPITIDPCDEWHLEQSKKYDYFKMGLFAEDFALMQDVASEVLKMNRGQVKGKKGIDIMNWKAKMAKKNHDKKMLKLNHQENLQLEIIEDLHSEKIRISADLEDLKFQKQQVDLFVESNKNAEGINTELLNKNEVLVENHNNLQRQIKDKELLLGRSDDMQWFLKRCDDAGVPTEITDGNNDTWAIGERARVRLYNEEVLSFNEYVFRNATWWHSVDAAIGAVRELLTKAQRTFNVKLWFDKKTRNLNVHKDVNKVKIETQELPIKLGVQQKLDPNAPREDIPQIQTIREQQKIVPKQVQTLTQNNKPKISI
jgi:hypothetical protein